MNAKMADPPRLSELLPSAVLAAPQSPTLPTPIKPTQVGPRERIIFFPTLAARDPANPDRWLARIHGWAFDPHARSLKRRALLAGLSQTLGLERREGSSETFKQRALPFLVDNLWRRRIAVRVGNAETVMPPTTRDGHFEGTVLVPAAAASPGEWLEVRAILPDGDPRRFCGSVLFPADRGISVVSDIDDTLRETNVASVVEMLRGTFTRPMKAVPGMRDVLLGEAGSKDATFHYVSASPWQLYEPLWAFFRRAGFPQGTMHLRRFRGKDRSAINLFRDPSRMKLSVIERLLAEMPGRDFVLIGDSGEHDAMVYAALAREHEGRIASIVIRLIEPEHRPVCEAAFAGIAPSRWRLLSAVP